MDNSGGEKIRIWYADLQKIECWEGSSLKFSGPPGTGPKTADTNMLAHRKGICKPRRKTNKHPIFL